MTPERDRTAWLGLLATVPADGLDAVWPAAGEAPLGAEPMAPGIGGGMVRGRTGGVGAAAPGAPG